MRFLLSLLHRGRALLLLLALEVVAIALIVNNQSYQRSRFLNSTNRIAGSLLAIQNNVSSYLNLKAENNYLARRNAALQNVNHKAYMMQSSRADTATDTIYEQRYTFTTAQIIGSSHFKRKNFATLNKGTLSGIQASDGVLSPNGVYGVVKSSSKHFSSVIPIINPQLSLSGKLKKSGYFGPLSWNGKDYRYAQVNDIPRYAKVKKGDTVVTDARSHIFPADIVIGTVVDYELQEDQNFYQLTIELATDFSRTEHVTIVRDLFKKELQHLDSLNTRQP